MTFKELSEHPLYKHIFDHYAESKARQARLEVARRVREVSEDLDMPYDAASMHDEDYRDWNASKYLAMEEELDAIEKENQPDEQP